MGKPKKHKRKGPKSTRSGCLHCKPHKDQAFKDSFTMKQHAEKKKQIDAKQQLDETG